MAFQDLCRAYGITFKKRLGQNLLLDDNINRIMVDAAGLTLEDDVIEVGAGLGMLTERLRQYAGRVLAVEIDKMFMPCLEDRFGASGNVFLFRGDILNHPLSKLIDEYIPNGASYKMVSNLPYYITTPILFHFLESPIHFNSLTIMLQEEVAVRMTAETGTHDYGTLSLMAHYYAEVDIIHKVPASCFRPMPKVDSCIVRLRCRKEPLFPDVPAKFLSKLIQTAFSQRRKILRNSLTRSGNFGVHKQAVLDAMDVCEIDPTCRPQTLSLDRFGQFAHAIRERMDDMKKE